MSGWPVWLASASLRDRRGQIRSALGWDEPTAAAVSATLDTLLAGVGDPAHEREFVMCVTLCRHRALTEAEFAQLPAWWHEADAVDIAGGPVAVRWSRGVPATPAIEPCTNPGRERVGDPIGGLYLPEDCGQCEPCRARASCRSLAGAAVSRPW